jgi:hypothetical protein
MEHQEINTQNKKCHLGLKLLPNADRILGSHAKERHNYRYTNWLSQLNKINLKHRARLTKGQLDVTNRLIPTKHMHGTYLERFHFVSSFFNADGSCPHQRHEGIRWRMEG